MKTCFKCGVCQPRANFYKHSQMADGLLGKCKACTRADVATHRGENIEKIREYDRNRGKTEKRKEASKKALQKWRESDQRITQCHNAVARAIQSGALQRQPCAVCGSDDAVAHHESYSKPLDVVFYCQAHHKQRHAEMKKSGINPLALE